MIKKLFRKFSERKSRVDPEDLNKQTAKIEAHLEAEGPRMNAIATYLEWRGTRNGFGEDFEILVPRRFS